MLHRAILAGCVGGSDALPFDAEGVAVRSISMDGILYAGSVRGHGMTPKRGLISITGYTNAILMRMITMRRM